MGYRRSGTLDRVTTLEEQVEAIAVVHRACSSDPAWVFGWSAGGNWAVAYALAHPDRVRGLVLMEPALYPVIPPGSRSPGVVAMIESVGPLFRAARLREEAIEGFWQAVAACLSPDWRPGWESLAAQPLVVSWCPTPQSGRSSSNQHWSSRGTVPGRSSEPLPPGCRNCFNVAS